MGARQANKRLEDFIDFEDDWEDGEPIQRIRRRDRPQSSTDQRRDSKRKRDRRREPPLHKRDE